MFKIVEVQRTNPATFILEDSRGNPIAGGFYEYKLQRVANPDVYLVEKIIRKYGDNVYVKWLGMHKSHNSWIHKNNVLLTFIKIYKIYITYIKYKSIKYKT